MQRTAEEKSLKKCEEGGNCNMKISATACVHKLLRAQQELTEIKCRAVLENLFLV